MLHECTVAIFSAEDSTIPYYNGRGITYLLKKMGLTLSLPILYLKFVWVISILKPKIMVKRSLYKSKNRILLRFSGWIVSE
jgi:hypothetical protein